MTRGPAAAYLLVTLLGLFVFFFGLGSCGIFDLDEGLYVEAAREMRTGDFVTPRVNNEPFFEKPPLIYWLSAVSMIEFGRNEFTARLPSALASLLTALLILWFGTRVFGLRTGTLAACMFTLSPIVFGEARQLTTDATLNLLLTGSMIALFLAWFDSPERSRNALILWALCGLGVLAKGLPGILIPVLAACLFALAESSWSFKSAAKSLLRLRPLIGALLFLAIATPWHIAAYRQSGEAFTQEYIIRQHLGRFRGGDTAHRAPFWFYIPGFMLGMFPWSFFVPAALLELRKRSKNQTNAGVPLSDEELRHERAFEDWLDSNREHAYAEYRRRFGKVVGSDNVRELYKPYAQGPESRTELAQAVDRPAKDFAAYMFTRMLEEAGGEVVVFTGGGGGSGKTLGLQTARIDKDNRVHIINDTTLSREREAVERIEAALRSGRYVLINYVHRPFDHAVRGVIERAINDGRPVPLQAVAWAHFHSQRVLLYLADRYAGNDRVDFRVADNSGSPGELHVVSLDAVRQNLYNELESLIDRAREILDDGYQGIPTILRRDRAEDRGRAEQVRPGTAREGRTSIPRSLYVKLVGEGSAGSEQAAGSGQVGAARRLLAIWSLLVFVLFSLSGSKLISYILPMYGPAALLAADWYIRIAESSQRATRRIAIILAAATSIVFLIVLNYRSIIHLIESRTHKPVSLESITPDVIAFVIQLLGMAALACLLFLIASRYRRQLAMPALTIGMVGFFGVAILEGLPAIDSAFLAPLHRLSAKATSGDFGHIILSSVPRRPSAIFYMPDEIYLKELLIEPKPDKLAETMRAEGASISAILTQSKTASAVAGIGGFRIVESAGGWALLKRP